MRGLILASLLAFACCAQAHAAPKPLAYVKGYTAFALGGETAYAGGPGGVISAPPTRVVLKTRDEIVRLDASPTRFAAATATGVVTGPPARTFAAPALVQFDGERLFTITETGATAYDPDPKPIVLPARSAPELARFAGDLMAVPTTWSERDPHYPSRRLVIQNWRTGAVLRSVDLPDEILSLDLRPDGRAVAVIAAGTLYDIAPGADPRFVAFADPGARFAGDHVVFARANELHVLDPGGRIRAFGIRTHRPGQFTTDDTRVLFTANDCLVLAPVTDALATDVGAGPCPRSEFEFERGRPGREAGAHAQRPAHLRRRPPALPRAAAAQARHAPGERVADDRGRVGQDAARAHPPHRGRAPPAAEGDRPRRRRPPERRTALRGPAREARQRTDGERPVKRLLVLITLAFPATAHADARPLARVPAATQIALAGENVVFASAAGRLARVSSVSLDGGPSRRVFAWTAPKNAIASVQVSASGQRAAVALVAERNDTIVTQAFAGVLGAPWAALGAPTRLLEGTNVFGVQLDGDRLFSFEARGSLANIGVTVRDPEPHDVPFYSPEDASGAEFAGDLVAYASVPSGEADEDAPHRIVLKNWRTGETLGTVELPYPAEIGALRADGAVLTRGNPIRCGRPAPRHASSPRRRARWRSRATASCGRATTGFT